MPDNSLHGVANGKTNRPERPKPAGGPALGSSQVQEEIIHEAPRLGPDSEFTFRCGKDMDCFGRCCRDVSIVLTPYDVLRMKRALGIPSGEFLEKYTISPFTPEQKIPVVLLRMDAETKNCLFVTEDGCSIYANRPWACRMYPLGVADPKTPSDRDRRFHFLMTEDLCHGHSAGKVWTVREWIGDQGVEEYDMMGEGFKELMLHDFWDRSESLTPPQIDMYFMACYDLDRFRRFVFETKFLQMFDVDEARVEAIRTSDVELLEFGMQWLRFALFKEKKLKVRREVMEAWNRRAEAGPETMHERLANPNG